MSFITILHPGNDLSKFIKELHNVACHFKNEQLSEGQLSKHRTRVHMIIAKNEESETQV